MRQVSRTCRIAADVGSPTISILKLRHYLRARHLDKAVKSEKVKGEKLELVLSSEMNSVPVTVFFADGGLETITP